MASLKQLNERKDNISAIISFIRKNKSPTRMEICAALSLSWACVSDLVAFLLAEEILLEASQLTKVGVSSAKGRTPTRLFLNEKKYFLGVDINDSGIAVTTISMVGEQISSRKWNGEYFKNENELANSVCDKISQMLLKKEDCCGIGVAMEGSRSEDGAFRYPLASGCVSVFPDKLIAHRFGLPVLVKHDPECILYSVSYDCKDRIAVRVDNWIGIAAMKHGKILELPLELGWIRYGDQKLHDILRSCAKSGNYREIAEALGRSVGNLSVLLGIQTCFLAGDVVKWLDGIEDSFASTFKQANPQGKYQLCVVSDASDGAARLAMAEFSAVKLDTKGRKTGVACHE